MHSFEGDYNYFNSNHEILCKLCRYTSPNDLEPDYETDTPLHFRGMPNSGLVTYPFALSCDVVTVCSCVSDCVLLTVGQAERRVARSQLWKREHFSRQVVYCSCLMMPVTIRLRLVLGAVHFHVSVAFTIVFCVIRTWITLAIKLRLRGFYASVG